MHKLFRRPPPSPNPTVNEDDDQQNQPLLPSVCTRLGSEDISIVGDHPARCGAFADVWDGSLAGSRVVIKSYRTYSTQARTVRVHRYLQAFSFTDLPPATETIRKRWHVPNFPIKTSSHSAPHTSPRSTRWLSSTTSWNTETLGNI